MKSLEGKKVLVTGAKRGLGKSLVNSYRRVGAKVIPMTREECDLRDTNQIYSFLDSVGRVDVLVNCAGVFPLNELHNISLKQYNECIQVNLTAPFILSQELSKGMIERGWGRIVNIASSSAYGGGAKTSVYCASKHALLGLSRSLFAELKSKGVRVICVSPGTIKTDMGKDVEKLGQTFDTFMNPDEVAEYIVYNTSLNDNMVSEEIRLNRMFVQ
jgi:NAD(P)-dependent dehydrogenase (short-subunit alcohol dehydrogenase family)